MTSMERGSCTRESVNKELSLHLKNYKTERHATLEKKTHATHWKSCFEQLRVKICRDVSVPAQVD